MTKAEYFVGTSENIDKNLSILDIKNSNNFLNNKENIYKYYETIDINDINYLRKEGYGRCTYCHANIDKTCGIKLIICLNGGNQCYRRKYLL